jgi:hypothetical protein
MPKFFTLIVTRFQRHPWQIGGGSDERVGLQSERNAIKPFGCLFD